MINTFNIPEHLHQRLRSELKAGEFITWAGQPIPSTYMKSGMKLWFFFIPWTAFSIFWIAGASGFEIPSFEEGWSLFPLFGLPFFLIGIMGLSSPFWLKKNARSMIYAVTDQRAITISGIKTITVKSIPLNQIKNIERVQHANGSGDLVLQTRTYLDNDGDRSTEKFGFFAIDNVKKVQTEIEQLLKSQS